MKNSPQTIELQISSSKIKNSRLCREDKKPRFRAGFLTLSTTHPVSPPAEGSRPPDLPEGEIDGAAKGRRTSLAACLGLMQFKKALAPSLRDETKASTGEFWQVLLS